MPTDVTREEFRTLEDRVDLHDVQLAVFGTNQTSMQKSLDAVVSELVKTRWTLIAFALSGIGIAIGIK